MEYGIRKLTVTLDPKAIKILEEKEKKNKIKEDAVIGIMIILILGFVIVNVFPSTKKAECILCIGLVILPVIIATSCNPENTELYIFLRDIKAALQKYGWLYVDVVDNTILVEEDSRDYDYCEITSIPEWCEINYWDGTINEISVKIDKKNKVKIYWNKPKSEKAVILDR